jgi:hypothetical protein
MTSRAGWLLIGLAGIAGCDFPTDYPYRTPCDDDAGRTCCPPGSHQESDIYPDTIICAPDPVPCEDAGADAGACTEGGADAP